MKPVNRVFSTLLCIVILLSVFMSAPFEAGAVVKYSFEEDGIRYLLLDESTVSVVYYNSEVLPENVVIPSTVQGKTVVAMDNDALHGAKMKTLTLPESITTIGQWAFASCRNLESVTVLSKITTLKDYTFEDCTSLKEVNLPESLHSISWQVFSGCTALETFYCPKNLTFIANKAFEDCTSLKQVIINPELTTISNFAFANLTNLTDIIFEERTKPFTVGWYAFENCTNLKNFDFTYCNNIGIGAFRSCKGLTSVTMSDYQDAKLESEAFSGCSNLETVKLSDNISSILHRSFVGCKKLKSIQTGTINNVGKSAFSGCENLEDVSFAKDNDITSVDDAAFKNCSKLTEISLVDAEYIDSEAFENCYNLKKVETSKALKTLKTRAFFGCESLETIDLTGISNIQESTFENCYSLKKVDVSEKLQSIRTRAFYNCISLPDFFIPETVEVIESYAFACFDYNNKIYVNTDFVVRGSDKSLAKKFADAYGVKWGAPAPILKSASNVKAGIKVTFKQVSGFKGKYRVYRKADGTSWKKVADVTGSSYTDTSVKVGTKYTYTVKLVTNKESSPYDTKGVSTVRLTTPEISKITNVNDGMTISWKKSSGASSYIVYVKYGDDWEEIGETTSTSLTYSGSEYRTLVAGKTYRFTLKAVDSTGKYKSGCVTSGWNNKYIVPPQITKLSNAEKGVKITWGKVAGAEKYRVFVKSGSSWKKLGDTTSTSYTHTSAKSGETYVYTVRCISSTGKSYKSGYDTKGNTMFFLATPVVKSISNTADGAKITYTAVAGAGKYNIYAKSGSSWNKIGESETTTFIHENAKSGTTYSYRVRAYDDMLEYSSYYKTSSKNTFIAAPVIENLENTSKGVKITWGKVDGAEKYRVFVKSGSSWKKLKDTTSTSYTHTKAEDGKSYTYTVRCISSTGKSYKSGYDKIGESIVFEK